MPYLTVLFVVNYGIINFHIYTGKALNGLQDHHTKNDADRTIPQFSSIKLGITNRIINDSQSELQFMSVKRKTGRFCWNKVLLMVTNQTEDARVLLNSVTCTISV